MFEISFYKISIAKNLARVFTLKRKRKSKYVRHRKTWVDYLIFKIHGFGFNFINTKESFFEKRLQRISLIHPTTISDREKRISRLPRAFTWCNIHQFSKDLLLSSSMLLQPKEERKSFNPCSSVPAVSILSMVATDNGEHAKFLWKPSLASLRRACFTISKLKSMVLVGNKDGLFVLGFYYDFELANIYFVTETGKAM